MREPVDEHALVDANGGQHRSAGDSVRLDEERLDARAQGRARSTTITASSIRAARAATSSPWSLLLVRRRMPRRPPDRRPAAPSGRTVGARPGLRGRLSRRPRGRRPGAALGARLRRSLRRHGVAAPAPTLAAPGAPPTAPASCREPALDRDLGRRASGARGRGRACPRGLAGSTAWRDGRRRGRRPRCARSSASAAGRFARRRRRTTACVR